MNAATISSCQFYPVQYSKALTALCQFMEKIIGNYEKSVYTRQYQCHLMIAYYNKIPSMGN